MIPAEGLPRKSHLAALLDHFADVEDPRDVRRILHSLPEMLLLVVCGTIADCDDCEDIAAWGAAHLGFLRRHLPFANGVPGERWLTILMNRINPALFAAWVRVSWPEKAGFIAIDGKTSRRSHARARGREALHLVFAWADGQRLVLGQEAVTGRSNEITAIPLLLERLEITGALLTIDAISCQTRIAQAVQAKQADYLLAVKANWPALQAEIERHFAGALAAACDRLETTDGDHGRIEVRRHAVSRDVAWLTTDRRHPGEPHFPGLTAVAMVEAEAERAGTTTITRRFYLSSARLDAATFVRAVPSN